MRIAKNDLIRTYSIFLFTLLPIFSFSQNKRVNYGKYEYLYVLQSYYIDGSGQRPYVYAESHLTIKKHGKFIKTTDSLFKHEKWEVKGKWKVIGDSLFLYTKKYSFQFPKFISTCRIEEVLFINTDDKTLISDKNKFVLMSKIYSQY